ncbi:S24 family peptidase [Legionella dresdenensis]|uniref:S24 family peptidase n=1 Tax=Legionella dresdenensis TaxID=450200 RepID=A0ABV8CFD6_9GAMM
MSYKIEKDVELHNILGELIKRDGITVAELARQVNLPQPSIQRIASGLYKNPRTTTLQPIANYFGITINQLRGYEPIPSLVTNESNLKSIPLVTISQMNNWPDSFTNIKQHVVCNQKMGANSFATFMPDCSMEPIIPRGAILLTDPGRCPHHKSYVIVKLQDYPEIIVRQLITDTEKHFVKPFSPELSHLEMRELKEYDKIIGVIIEIRYACEEY